MLYRKGLLVFCCLTLLLSFSSCTKSPEKKIKIGFSQCLGTDSWRKTMLAEMNRELSFHNNFELIYKNADGNSKLQVEQIKELVDEKIDLLIVSPNEVNPLTPAVEKIYDAGIPVVVIDRRTGSNKYTAFIGASNFEVGQNAGRYAASVLKGKGNVIEVTGIPDASPVIDRHNGFMAIIKDYKSINYLRRFHNYSTDSTNKNPVYQFLLANPNVDFIYAQNDYMAFDMYKMCKRLGLRKIKIIGIDGLPQENEGLDMVASKSIDATVLYPTGGSESILTAVNILQKKPYKKENQLFTTIIDSTNVRIMKLQNAKVLMQQTDIDRRQKIINRQAIVSKNQNNIIVAISVTLALALIFGGIVFYYLEENKKINRKLEQQKEKLEQQKEEIANQRNQLIELMEKVKEATDAKFNFYTNISHELRTPLTLIMGPLEDALSSTKLHFTVKNDLEFIRRNSIRLLRLINQLMDFRKIEEGKMKLHASENNLSAFVLDIAKTFNELARKKHINFEASSKVNELKAWFDVTMLDKVLFNLLSNAFKFTPEYGMIRVFIDTTTDHEYAIIKVEDSGIGMTSDESAHIFEKFFQVESNTVKGTGLGLSLSKELLQLHQGSITVKSIKNKGTQFELLLPLGNKHLEVDEIATAFPHNLNLYEDVKIYTTDIEPLALEQQIYATTEKELSILVIEDNEDLRIFLKQRLGQQYEIHTAENAAKGLDLAFDIIPDLVISDIILPGRNGLQITELLKQDIRTSHIPVILLTAKGSIEEQIEGIKTQADAFIVKPFNLEYFEETIKNLISNRVTLREHYTSELPTESRTNISGKMDRKFINQFTAIVEKNIENEDFSVDDLCKEIGISKKQLYRKAKALIGLNINDYILTVRLQKAKFLLSSEDFSISEVAFKVGFASQAYFSTVFKSKFGISPSEFKARKIGKS